ncbi:MAG: hypothetical protein ACRDTH_07820 [Pseudonocardiaceae bacterium]
MEPQEPINPEPICELINSLRDPEFRRSFLRDPTEALSRRGFDAAALPEDLLHQLSELTAPELRLLGELADTFAGYPVPEGGWPCAL